MKNKLYLKIMLIVLSLAALGIMIWTGIPILRYKIRGAQNEKALVAVRESYYHRASGDEDKVDEIVAVNSDYFRAQNYEQQYTGLLEINKEMVGWITIPDTNVDYPIVQTQDNLYYLGRNIIKHYSDRGAIFMDFRNLGDGTDKNTVIYGHNMYDGSMFGKLYKFKQVDYYKAHKNITINLKGLYTEWEVFAVYITNDDPVRTSFSSSHDFKEYLRIIDKKKMFETDINVNEDDQILTISTCTNAENSGRLVLHAKRVN